MRGKVELATREIPDVDEAKKLWREGKTAQQIFEIQKLKKKEKKP